MIDSTTIETWVSIAQISQYLANNDNLKQGVMQWGPAKGSNKIPTQLMILSDVVSWAKQYYVGTPQLDAVAEYMYALCGKYIARANQILNNASGIIVIPGTNTKATLAAVYVQFTIGDPDSPMNAGDTEYTLDYPYLMANSIKVETVNANLPQDDDTQVSYIVNRTDNNALITFNQGVQNDETYIITALRFVPA